MSHGKIEKFARMADQIGDYYATQPAGEAAAGVALHIRKFWTPKMIAETIHALDAGKVSLNATSAQGFAILKSEFEAAGD
jgi:formate dehydrogenase subunit delta